ncbi:hypothetical protein ACFL96_15390 [Thermoproteota archaeon]
MNDYGMAQFGARQCGVIQRGLNKCGMILFVLVQRSRGLVLGSVLLAVFCVTMPGPILGLDVTAKHHVSPNVASVGDVLEYQISVKHATDVNIELLESGNLGPFTIRDYKVSLDKSAEYTITKFHYLLTLFETGEFFIPTRNIRHKQFITPAMITLPSLRVMIKSVLPEDIAKQTLQPIKPPLLLRVDKKRYVVWGMLWLVILGLVCSGLFFWRKCYQKKRLAEKQEVMDTRTPREIALDELVDLKKQNLIEKGFVKAYYLRFSEILKGYFMRIFHEKILEMTTSELLVYLQAHVDEQSLKRIRKLLVTSDLVKFAQYALNQNEHDDHYSRAVEVIDRIDREKN